MRYQDYKVEDLKFLKMKKNLFRSGFKIFEIEESMSIEEKISFIDGMKDGIASYLLNIIDKWEAEKDNLPKDENGEIKKISLKKWIRKNDSRKIINRESGIVKYSLFGKIYRLNDGKVCVSWGFDCYLRYTDEHIVHQWFHDLCVDLYRTEKKYFEKNDPIQQKLSAIRNYANKFRLGVWFDNDELNNIVFNNSDEVPEERLDKYVEIYEKLDKCVNELEKELKEI